MRIRILLWIVTALGLVATVSAQPKLGVMRRIDATTPELYQALLLRSASTAHDFNRDGIPEIVTRTQGFYFEADGLTEKMWSYDASGSGMSNPRFLGFARLMATSGNVTHAVFRDSMDVRFLSVSDNDFDDFIIQASEPPTEEIGFVFHTITLKSGRDVVLYRDGSTLYVIGAVPSFTGAGSIISKDTRSMAAYDLVEKYTGAEGDRLGYDPDLFPLEGGVDFDGDGYDDLPVIATDGNGIPLGVAVYGGDRFEELWRWPFPSEYLERIMMGFHGFADVDGDGVKELFCGDNLVVFRDGSVQELRPDFRIRHLMDVDGDGLPDIIGRDLTADRVVALGKATATTVRALPVPAAAVLHPAHPNPASGATTLTFTLRQAGAVRLDIHDALGRRVRTLRDGRHEAGSFHVALDGNDAAGRPLPAGAYSAVLTIAGAVLRQGIIITR